MIFLNTNVVHCVHKNINIMNVNLDPRTTDRKRKHVPLSTMTGRSPYKHGNTPKNQAQHTQERGARDDAEPRCLKSCNHPNGRRSSTQPAQAPNSASKSASNDAIFKLWIHCNYCFEPYIKKRRPMHLLACYHLLCQNCLVQLSNQRYKCRMCEKSVSTVEISNDMPLNLKELFHPKPWIDNLQLQLPRINNFQRSHRRHLYGAMLKIKTISEKCKSKENLIDQLIVKGLREKRCIKIELVKLMRIFRSIAAWRAREKQRIEEQKKNKLQSLLSAVSAFQDQSCYDSSSSRDKRSASKFAHQVMPDFRKYTDFDL